MCTIRLLIEGDEAKVLDWLTQATELAGKLDIQVVQDALPQDVEEEGDGQA